MQKKRKCFSKHIVLVPNTTLDGKSLKLVDDFQYLGAWGNDTMKDNYRLAKSMKSILETQ